jgi:hypothetical protein
MKTKNPALRLKQAVDLLLHKPGTRLMQMHGRDGLEFYIVPGGRVDASDAQLILKRPDIKPADDDGTFPGCPQQWRRSR